ncbi:EGF domain-containing protein [Cinnamomum micranthum f. kanehirae]|uniref:EGF domain-containing protein n=1 Tax=Cinnamomum micranthum f. kanehirae TaxID=337451 RepID=A0A3S3N971_9MAGN|nr:EGF domain-containing protein [Cinnamomum micranthum f. kanehirae]
MEWILKISPFPFQNGAPFAIPTSGPEFRLIPFGLGRCTVGFTLIQCIHVFIYFNLHYIMPALVFSTAGHIGNYFHDFADVLVPLFITSRQYNGDIQFLITNFKPWWVEKYHVILKQLSKYEIINFDHDHQELSIEPSRDPNGYSIHDFIKLLRNSYSMARDFAITIGDDGVKNQGI